MIGLHPDLAFAVLSVLEQEVVHGWERELGLERGDWVGVPWLSTGVESLAVLRVAAGMPEELSPRDARRAASEALGVQDDPNRSSSWHPADALSQNLYRWQRASCRQKDEPPDSEVA